MIRLFPLTLLGLLTVFASLGADLSGIWTGTITDRNGDPQDLSFRFAQRGDVLTGKMYGDNESTPIQDAKIAGGQISFSVTSELNGQISTFVYTGTVEGNELRLTRVRTSNNGKKPGDAQAIVLKRLTGEK